MNCGCIVKGNPFDMNQRILEPCVIHMLHTIEKTKGLELQVGQYKAALEKIASDDWTDPDDGLPCDVTIIARKGLNPTVKQNQEGLKLGESRNLPYPQPIHDKDAVKRNHEHELERMSSLYSYLSLARHRYLKAPDDLLKDIDKALVEGEKILKPWWDEQMGAKNAEAAKKAK